MWWSSNKELILLGRLGGVKGWPRDPIAHFRCGRRWPSSTRIDAACFITTRANHLSVIKHTSLSEMTESSPTRVTHRTGWEDGERDVCQFCEMVQLQRGTCISLHQAWVWRSDPLWNFIQMPSSICQWIRKEVKEEEGGYHSQQPISPPFTDA